MSDLQQAKKRQEVIEQIEVAVAEVDGSCSRDAARAVHRVFQTQIASLEIQLREMREALEPFTGRCPNPELFPNWFSEWLTDCHQRAQKALSTPPLEPSTIARVVEAAVEYEKYRKLLDSGSDGAYHAHGAGAIEATKEHIAAVSQLIKERGM